MRVETSLYDRGATWAKEMHTTTLSNPAQFGLFYLFHVVLALLAQQFSQVATLHALATVAVGLKWATSRHHAERLAYIGAYICGAEILWRMRGAQIFWEFGKYATALIFLVAILRSGRIKGSSLPLLYFIMLLPSTVLTIEMLTWHEAQGEISFNLSGPFLLMLSAVLFSQVRLSVGQLYRAFLVLIGPILGIASITLFATYTASSLEFTSASNPITSGGWGPNQVSAGLGLGALVGFLCLLGLRVNARFRILLFGIVMTLATQSAMTFSRGGLHMAAASAVVGVLILFQDPRYRRKIVLALLLLVVVGVFVVLPALDSFTEGALSARFRDVDPTGRDRILMSDLRIWKDHPIFGVGPGRAQWYRGSSYPVDVSHTEASRLLAEHGLFGLAALFLLVCMVLTNFSRVTGTLNKAVVTSITTWSLLFLAGYGWRIAAPSFLMGLAFAPLVPERTTGLRSNRQNGRSAGS